MKNILRINELILVVFLFIISVFFFNSCASRNNIVEIGALLPLTGPGANYGKWESQGIDLAVEEINQNGGINGKQLKIIYEDIKSEPQIAVSAFNKLLTVNEINVFVAGISSVVLALAPIADKSHVVLMNCGGISPRIPKVTGNYVFSNIVDGGKEVIAMANFIYDSLGINRVAGFTIQSAAGIDAMNTFKKYFIAKGGKISIVEYHKPGDTDFRTQLVKIKSSNSGAVYLTSFTKESALILRQASELSIKTRWFSYAPFEGQEILDIAGKDAEGVIYTSQAFNAQSKDFRVKQFQDKYYKYYKEFAEIYAATFYDGIYIIAEALKSGALSGLEIRNAIREIKSFEGVTGKIQFDTRQVAIKPIIFKIVKNGMFVNYQDSKR